MVLSYKNYIEIITTYVDEFKIEGLNLPLFFDKVSSGLALDMTPTEMTKYCSEIAATMITIHPSYNKLAAIILIKHLHENTFNTFSDKMMYIQQEKNIFDNHIMELIINNMNVYNSIVKYERDYNFDYFALISLQKSYQIQVNNTVIERPQDIYMRVAIELHGDDFNNVQKTYDLLSQQYYTHATPTLYNSCFKKNQLASCFLLGMKSDTIAGIFDTIKEAAIYSKLSGGVGLHISNLRCDKSQLVTTGGYSKGIIPIVKLINDSMKYINQGGARRCATCAFYLEPWHKDILKFLDLRKNTGIEEERARDSFTALWINDLFMERVEKNEMWSLFDPNIAKGLQDVWGDQFNKLYAYYEETIERTTIPAQKLWKEIICSQIETGTPYMCYKDTCNRYSNQNNIGTIKSSNLCAEIIQYSDSDITAVCNLASICLPKYVKINSTTSNYYFDFQELYTVVKIVTYNMNKMIDKSAFPTEESKKGNSLFRPIGIGVQGLADVFFLMGYSFESKEARDLNKMIFETLYFGALEASCELAQKHGPYSYYQGSMYTQGIFHFEKFCEGRINVNEILSGMWNWEELRIKMKTYGVRNSLTLALMPTASTSQICGNSECIEPIQSNIFTRRTFAGEFQIVNKYLMKDLIKLGLWNNEIKQLIIEYEGSIQKIPIIPQHVKDLYKTVWELKMKSVLDMAIDRQAFVDQSQSLNLFVKEPTYGILSSMHFYGWKNKLKTGMYYLRTCPLAKAIKFTVDKELILKTLSSFKDSENDKKLNKENDYCEGCSC